MKTYWNLNIWESYMFIWESEHMWISAYMGKAVSQSALSSNSTYKKQTGHNVSFDDFKIISSAMNQFDALICESLLTSEMKPSLNANICSFPLALF